MKIFNLLILALCTSVFAEASVVGISTHPLNEEARILSLETTAYMSQRREMGLGLRFTQEIQQGQLLDLVAGSGQDSRGFYFGGGTDFEILRDEDMQPRISIKPFYRHQKFEDSKSNLIGVAPTLRKGFNILGTDFFPYLAVPLGVQIDSSDDGYVYYASLSLGASMAIPNTGDRLLVSVEGNKNMGASSDYLSALISWVWN